uniref:CASP8 and FADD like apoptosis regulator n=1 Tax=Sphenodon punctatus TaxID=8508 RepID=A0A8D0GCX9_SPHPU
MTVYRVPATLIHQIEEELDKDENEVMLFLCRDLVPDLPAVDTRELLAALNERGRLMPNGIFYGLPLKTVAMSCRVLMVEISEGLDKKEVSSLIFLLQDYMQKMTKEKNFLGVVIDLEKLNLIASDQLDLIEDCLLSIHRVDLKKKIQKYKQECKMCGEGGGLPCTLKNWTNYGIKSLLCIMQKCPLGICLIIDCIGNDTEILENSFRTLHFEVRCHRFSSMETMKQRLHEVARQQDHKDYDCFACVLVSRGSHHSIFCTDQSFPGFSLEMVKDYFVGDSCPELRGKPKLFFIQSYIVPGNQQETTSLVEVDGDSLSIPQVADIFWSHCKVDVSILERSPSSSSYYLCCLAELLCHPRMRKRSLQDIHVVLNRRVYEWSRIHPKEQCSLSLQHTLRKKLFLSPR